MFIARLLIVSLMLLSPLVGSAQSDLRVRDIGVIGLFSHDIFTWDHKEKINLENGVLDLSTIFEYDGGSRWQKGGNPKNEENAPVYTFTMELVEYYLWKSESLDPVQARKETVKYFIAQVIESYQRLTDEVYFFEANSESANNVEQASLRAMHDILPGWIKLFRDGEVEDYKVTGFWGRKKRLNQWEMQQSISAFNGDYDEEYKNINIIIKKINLKKIDRAFIEDFSPYKQEDMLEELKLFGERKIRFTDLSFGHHLTDLLNKSLDSRKSEWLPRNPQQIDSVLIGLQ
ncbi:MAG: hypothetical protein CL674_06525 [Bdellovibrionaceae bacterium]|mgnify:CR=1 FL=1|nr:hypothetical protein [Pseudobdellovibrionaceae bacterium]